MNVHFVKDPDKKLGTADCSNRTVNVGDAERIVSLIAGGGMVLAGLRKVDSLAGLALAAMGSGFLFRGASGFCGLYHLLGVSTRCESKAGDQIQQMTKSCRAMDPEDEVEEASDESFPASDPPSWTSSSASRSVKPRPR